MARQFTVTLTSGTDSGPYNIYYDSVSSGTLATLCGTSNLAENLTLSQVQSGVCVEVPNDADRIIFYNTNPDIAKDCETNQEVHELTNNPTATPVPDPTSTPVPDPTATPVPDPTATPVIDPTATPVPDPTETPTPTPSATPEIIRNLKFQYCNTISTEVLSEGETTAVGNPEVNEYDDYIYLTSDDYGSIPSVGDTAKVHFGSSNHYCYEYVGLETGVYTSWVYLNTNCTCPVDPTATPTATPTPTPTPSPTPVISACVIATFTASGGDLIVTYNPCGGGKSQTLTVLDGNIGNTVCADNNSWTYNNIEFLGEVSTASCDLVPDPTATSPDEGDEGNRYVTGCTTNNVFIIKDTEVCLDGALSLTANPISRGDVIWISSGCGGSVDECAVVGDPTSGTISAIRREENTFSECSTCYLP